MNKEALFCDSSRWYVNPQEPLAGGVVTFKFRTASQEAVRVFLCTGSERYRLEKKSTKDNFDYHEVQCKMNDQAFRYYFEVEGCDEVCVYQRSGVEIERVPEMDFEIIPGFQTPDWAKGAVMYQIFTDRFFNGDPTNDVLTGEYYYVGGYSVKVEDWDKYPDVMGVREFYGGDLEGVRQKLDYLQELGVEVIYFNPLFVSPSNHKYDIQDYDYIDPHLGVILEDGGEVLEDGDTQNSHATRYKKRVANLENLEASNSFFAEFVKEVHARGMKVILDGVFNHCGSFNKWLDRERIYEGQKNFAKGAYISSDSPYRTYFKFLESNWPYNPKYDGWWGFDTLPKLNYEMSKKLESYIFSIARKWVSEPYNADGWRLDVAADLGYHPEYNHRFWKNFRKEVKKANSEAIILAEHYGNPKPWLGGDEWDTVMNYDAFMEPVTWYLTGMEKHSDEKREDLLGNSQAFVDAMDYHMLQMPRSSQEVSMNQLSNHDHSRFLTRTNGVVGRVATLGPEAAERGVRLPVMRMAVVMQMTWVGAPTIYYGDEAGVCGFTDPDDRRTYPWGRENTELINFHKGVVEVHKNSEALRNGSLMMLSWHDGMLSYARFTDEEQMIVVLNREEYRVNVKIPVWKAGVTDRQKLRAIVLTEEDVQVTDEGGICLIDVHNGYAEFEMEAVSAVVFLSV